jgi:hypothetical protein
MVDSLDLSELGRKLTRPHLLAQGLCTPEDMKEFKDLLECPKEIWPYAEDLPPDGRGSQAR